MANTKISALTSATTPLAGTEVLPIVQSSATVKVAVSDLTAGRSISVSGLTNTGLTASKPVFTDASKVLTSTGVVPVANGGTNASAASITAFNNITGYTAAGATGTTSTNLVFSTSPSITTPTLVGDVTVSTGNVVIGTSGKGIDFSATPSAGTSELFADYEEGTYTATMTPETSGTITLNAGINELSYTKMGRIVTITGLLYVDSVSSPVGTYVAVSLPTTIADLTDLAGRFGTTCYGKSTTLPLIGFESTSAVRIIVTASTVATGNEFWLSFSYVSA